MFLPRQEMDDTDTVVPDDGVTVEKVKSCAGGEFASCSMPIIFGALAAAGLLAFIIWYWWRSKKNKGNRQTAIDKAAQEAAEKRRAEEAADANKLNILRDFTTAAAALAPSNTGPR